MLPKTVYILATDDRVESTTLALSKKSELDIKKVSNVENRPEDNMLYVDGIDIASKKIENVINLKTDIYIIAVSDELIERIRMLLIEFGISYLSIRIFRKDNPDFSMEDNLTAYCFRWPEFIILGAQKCGTTWLQHNLNKHPEIYIPDNEINFFSVYWDEGLFWYLNKFIRAKEHQIIGDKSPRLLPFNGKNKTTPAKIFCFTPHSKLIICIRNPVDRLISSLWHNARYGLVNLEMKNFDRNFVTNGKINDFFYDSALTTGYYSEGIKIFLQYFSMEQLHFVIFEETVLSNESDRLRNTFEFLNVAPDIHLQGISNPVYRNPYKKLEISNETRTILLDHYRAYNEDFFEIIGREIKSWYK